MFIGTIVRLSIFVYYVHHSLPTIIAALNLGSSLILAVKAEKKSIKN